MLAVSVVQVNKQKFSKQFNQTRGNTMNKQFNVLQTNTQSVNRTELLSKLSKEEQLMFNKFVKSVNSK